MAKLTARPRYVHIGEPIDPPIIEEEDVPGHTGSIEPLKLIARGSDGPRNRDIARAILLAFEIPW